MKCSAGAGARQLCTRVEARSQSGGAQRRNPTHEPLTGLDSRNLHDRQSSHGQTLFLSRVQAPEKVQLANQYGLLLYIDGC